MEIKSTTNPIGFVNEVAGLNDLCVKLKGEWALAKQTVKDISLISGVQFLTNCLDQLICYLVNENFAGAEKKATAMAYFSTLYDTVAADFMPVYLVIFSSTIKDFIVGIVVNQVIDFMVDKYKNGSWSVPAQPEAPKN